MRINLARQQHGLSGLPTNRGLGGNLLFSLDDLVQPAIDLAAKPGFHTPAELSTAIFNGSGARVAGVRGAIAAVEALHPGYGVHADAARASLHAWIAALPFERDTTPLRGGHPVLSPATAWVVDAVNSRLRRVLDLAGIVAPGDRVA